MVSTHVHLPRNRTVLSKVPVRNKRYHSTAILLSNSRASLGNFATEPSCFETDEAVKWCNKIISACHSCLCRDCCTVYQKETLSCRLVSLLFTYACVISIFFATPAITLVVAYNGFKSPY